MLCALAAGSASELTLLERIAARQALSDEHQFGACGGQWREVRY